MDAQSNRFQAAIEKFDASNAGDPNLESVDGKPCPSALVYGQRMTHRLGLYAPDASEALQLAARAQHIQRWAIARGDYPEGIKGYNRWRRAMASFHAERAGEILKQVGYEESLVARVRHLLQKGFVKMEPEVQQLEDVACLIFLEFYLVDFSRKHEREKVVDIIRKAWRKMSDSGHQAALELTLPGQAQEILTLALENG